MTRVAILDRFHSAIQQIVAESMPAGWEMKALSPDNDLESVIASAEVAFVMSTRVDAALLAKAPALRLIHRLGVGYEKIDLDACKRQGVALARITGGNSTPVAEHAMAMILAGLRRLTYLDRTTRAGEWRKEEARGFQRQLTGKTVGIVGFGAIGRQLAKMLAGFEPTILFYDPVPPPADTAASLRAHSVPLEELLARSDIVSLHLPLLPETEEMINASKLALMKSDAILVNCARGELIDEAALQEVLERGALRCACLDTFHNEPVRSHPLYSSERTIVTPHVAGATLDNFASVMARAVRNAEGFVAGRGIPAADLVYAPGG